MSCSARAPSPPTAWHVLQCHWVLVALHPPTRTMRVFNPSPAHSSASFAMIPGVLQEYVHTAQSCCWQTIEHFALLLVLRAAATSGLSRVVTATATRCRGQSGTVLASPVSVMHRHHSQHLHHCSGPCPTTSALHRRCSCRTQQPMASPVAMCYPAGATGSCGLMCTLPC